MPGCQFFFHRGSNLWTNGHCMADTAEANNPCCSACGLELLHNGGFGTLLKQVYAKVLGTFSALALTSWILTIAGSKTDTTWFLDT